MRMFSSKKMGLVALLVTLLGASSALAQQVTTSQQSTNFDDQLAIDVTPVPPGSGAIFVPTLSNPKNESHVVVYFQGNKVTEGRTGERIIVPPGEYEVVVGTGNLDSAAKTRTRVVDGATMVVQPFFGGVQLTAVDTDGHPVAVSYAIRQDGQRVVNTTTPTDGDETPARTYLLKPGPKTWEFSDGTELAFDLPRGEKTAYRAIFDGEKFVGLQHADVPLEVVDKWWRARWTIGADVSFSYAQDQISDFSGMYGQLGGFSDAELGVDYMDHLLTLKINVDQSWLMVDSEHGANIPIRSMRDAAKAELLYAYRWYRVFGPFVRVGAQTALFETNFYATENTTVNQVDKDGKHVRVMGSRGAGESWTLLKPFSPLFVEEAVGVNLTVVDNSVFDFILLGGVGARQHLFREDSYFIKSSGAGELNVQELKTDLEIFGAFAEGKMGLRLGQSFRLSASGKMFVPYQQIFGTDGKDKEAFNPIFSVSGMAEFAINSFASLVYRGEWAQQTLETPTSMYHGASLRLHHNLF